MPARYVVVGAGAIGATLGGRLAEHGRDVVLVARGAHLDALRRDGLRLAMPDREIVVRPPACSLEDLVVRPGDVLILAVKSQDSEAALSVLARLPLIDSAGEGSAGDLLPVVCAQNGTANEDTALRWFARVHGMCVNIPATHLEPGRVEAQGAPTSGLLQVGGYPSGSDDVDRAVARDLTASGFVAAVREDVMAWKRAKLLRNLGNALEVLCGSPRAQTAPDPSWVEAVTQVQRRLADEARSCMAAAGLSIVDDEEYRAAMSGRSQVAVVGGAARQGGSTWQSVRRGQGSVETDFLNGEIVLLGRRLGIATPLNERVQSLMRAVVRSGGQPEPIDPVVLLSR